MLKAISGYSCHVVLAVLLMLLASCEHHLSVADITGTWTLSEDDVQGIIESPVASTNLGNQLARLDGEALITFFSNNVFIAENIAPPLIFGEIHEDDLLYGDLYNRETPFKRVEGRWEIKRKDYNEYELELRTNLVDGREMSLPTVYSASKWFGRTRMYIWLYEPGQGRVNFSKR
jgi:hypothetical protein